MLTKIVGVFRAEPARIIMLAMALLALGAQFGVHLSDPQIEAIKNVVSILLAFVGGAEGTRSLVSPTGSKGGA